MSLRAESAGAITFSRVEVGYRFRVKPGGRVYVKIRSFRDERRIRRNAVVIGAGRCLRIAPKVPVYPVGKEAVKH